MTPEELNEKLNRFTSIEVSIYGNYLFCTQLYMLNSILEEDSKQRLVKFLNVDLIEYLGTTGSMDRDYHGAIYKIGDQIFTFNGKWLRFAPDSPNDLIFIDITEGSIFDVRWETVDE